MNAKVNNAVVGDNTFYALSDYVIIDMMNGGRITPGNDQSSVHFTSVSVSSCGGMSPGESAAVAARQMEVLGINPTWQDGDWLFYGNISANATGRGSKLLLDGEPLSARLIAVAATDVYWWDWHGKNGMRHFVDRAIGDAKQGPISVVSSLLYPDVIQNGITLNHLTKGPSDTNASMVAHGVTSECRDHANLFIVDPAFAIFAQVNYNVAESTGRVGSYSLWVKVIETE